MLAKVGIDPVSRRAIVKIEPLKPKMYALYNNNRGLKILGENFCTTNKQIYICFIKMYDSQ